MSYQKNNRHPFSIRLTPALLLFFLAAQLSWAQKSVLKVVEDNEENSALYGAALYFLDLDKGVTADESGVINIPASVQGEQKVRISFLGYETIEMTMDLPIRTPLTIKMKNAATELKDIVVWGQAESDFKRENQTSTISLTEMNLKEVPKLMGEPDLIRIIQNMPGVKVESDFSSGFNVRGGRNDQNLILLDGVPMYNPWHLFGIFSAFNNEAVSKVELSKGIFPAQYGGRLSSVLNVEIEDGSDRDGAGYLTVTPFSGSFSYGKALDNKTSVIFSVRRTYLDPILYGLSLLTKEEDEWLKSQEFFHYRFSDVNVKLTRKISRYAQMDLGYFYGVDRVRYKGHRLYKPSHPLEENAIEQSGLNFGWKNNTFNWRHRYHRGKISTSSQAYLTRFNTLNQYNRESDNWRLYGFNVPANADYYPRDFFQREKFEQKLTDVGINQDFGFELDERVKFNLGIQWQFHDFEEINSLRQKVYGSDTVVWIEDGLGDFNGYNQYSEEELKINFFDDEVVSLSAHELSFYARATLRLAGLKLYPGVRYHYFSRGNYVHLLPRINVNYSLTPKISLTAGYGQFTQYFQALSLDFIRIPSERWFWSDKGRPPALAKTYTAGIGIKLGKWGTLNVEGYHKQMDGLLNFSIRAQSQVFENGNIPQFPNETISGSGEAYGVEWFWNKTEGTVTGWLGYTLSWAWNQFEDINQNDPFPARTDKRHDIQAYGNWDLIPNLSIGLLFNYKTGQPVTFSTGYHINRQDPLGVYDFGGDTQVIIERNNFRLPTYHRLDLSITWKNRKIFKHKGELSLNVINVYNHINALTVVGEANHQVLPDKQLRIIPNNRYYGQLPLLPMLSLKVGLGKKFKWKEEE